MTAPAAWPRPQWLARIDDPKLRQDAEIRFYITLAALYCTESGNLADLSTCVGYAPGTAQTSKARAKPGAKFAIAIEEALGRDLFPRELFRPDLFVVEG